MDNKEQGAHQAPPFFKLTDAVVCRDGHSIFSVDKFELAEGESVAILGPNGSGKSTMAALLTRDIHPMHRDIAPVLIRGEERPILDDIKQCIGFVSASSQDTIKRNLSAIEVVEGGLFGSLGVPKRFKVNPAQREHAMDVMAELGVADLADRMIPTLSSGQARRVLIARALVHDPDMLIFDEPCTGLDPQGMYYVRKAMEDLIKAGRSVVLITHYPEDIVDNIERVVFIKDGRIIKDGDREDLLTPEGLGDLFEIPWSEYKAEGAQ